MKNHLKNMLPLLAFFGIQTALANAIDSLENQLRSSEQVQEKIYVHTDNNSYFVGDTIWFKTYLLRADDHRPSHMSKIMYVELLSPDGYLVERQRIIVDHNTQSFGQFALPDTMYSGFYELRAYTRWQLNFNVTERPHSDFDDRWFFNQELANDYFRDYEGLYSRVLPIYEKPEQTGNYADKRIIDRPKRRLAGVEEGLDVKVYPESGTLLADVENRVAFEVLDAQGKPLKIIGSLANGTKLETDDDGRGVLTIKPQKGERMEAEFTYLEQKYTARMPEVQGAGVVIAYDPIGQKARIVANGVAVAAVSVTCRGKLIAFNRNAQTIDAKDFPTGVNEIVAYDTEARPLATRQIFVNRGDIGQKIELNLFDSLAVKPFEKLNLQPSIGQLKTASIAVCDRRGDEPTYDDGNILTDLLLAGDLRGFVAHPARYFEGDDAEHQKKLDQLMMIQGWRKYVPVEELRFQPEISFAVEGQIYKLKEDEYERFDLMDYIVDKNNTGNAVFTLSPENKIVLYDEFANVHEAEGLKELEDLNERFENKLQKEVEKKIEEVEERRQETYTQQDQYNRNSSGLKHPIIVEAELNKGRDIAGIAVEVDSNGHFIFQMPPFYDQAILMMTAYEKKDSIKKCIASLIDYEKLNPYVSPSYYVRRDFFYPKFCKPYVWAQTHSSKIEKEDISRNEIYDADHILKNVTIKKNVHRALHSFDYSKPAFVYDFNMLLNNAIDQGLHYSCFNGIMFWNESARELFGNMNDPRQSFNLKVSVEGHAILKTYSEPTLGSIGTPMSPQVLKKRLDPRHILQVRVFTDYDMRNGVGKEENRGVPDVWFDVVPIPNEGKRAMRRDRRILIDGFAYPEQFYHRDYSGAALPDSSDYRRTLYWNPNVHPDKDGNLNIQFYNGARPAHLKVSICGVGEDGKIYYY